jgi:hypothetical protein
MNDDEQIANSIYIAIATAMATSTSTTQQTTAYFTIP